MSARDKHRLFFIFAGSIFAVYISFSFARGASTNPASAQYTTDTSTRLFENYDGTTQGTDSSGATFSAGYLSGSALRFSDTGSFVEYASSWWAADSEGFQEAGTIECFVRIDTFLTSHNQSYPTILTREQHPINPSSGGLPEFGFRENKAYFAVTANPPVYSELESDDELNTGQWYHLAATWGLTGRRLFVNGLEVDSQIQDTFIRAGTFFIGCPPSSAFQRGLGIVGVIDRFRLSDRARTADEFPSPLDVVIDSPTVDDDDTITFFAYTSPFPMTFRAFATETRPRLVDIYADTDRANFNGVVVTRNLPESGTFLVGAGLATGTYFFYAIAHADGDSAYRYISLPIQLTLAPGYASVVDPADTTATVVVTPATTESFTVVLLNNGGITPGSLVTAADSVGTNRNYTITTRLMNTFDTTKISIWTKETTPAILIGLRSDTTSLNTGFLPKRIPATAAGLNAFGATILSTKFLASNGRMIGDTFSKRYIGDTFAYTIEFQLSPATTLAFRNLGFDTAVGSKSFGFYFADTYGARWIEDSSCTVSVVAGVGGGINVRVAGITKDLDGGLGGASVTNFTTNFTIQSDGSGWCLLKSAGTPKWVLGILRAFRDMLLTGSLGRWLVEFYY